MEYVSISSLMNLSGKIAIVTGGAMGIGRGIVERLSEAGAGVVIADMNTVAATAAASSIIERGRKAIAIGVDVSDEAQVAALVARAVSEFGSIDILVNNAGIYPNIPVMQMKLADFEHVLAINLKGVFLCTKAVAAQMIKQGNGGKIINITSIDALHPSMVGLATYDANLSKGERGSRGAAHTQASPNGSWFCGD